MGEIARARGYLRPPTAGYFYIDILARAAARGRRPEGCGAGSYRPNGPIGPLPKPKFGRGDGRLGDRPAVAPSGWRETAVPMRGHRHHSRIGRANALTGRHARPSCPSSWPPASQQRGFSSLHQDHAWPAHLFSGPSSNSKKISKLARCGIDLAEGASSKQGNVDRQPFQAQQQQQQVSQQRGACSRYNAI